VAAKAEQLRRRQLEKGFNGIEDCREDRIRTIREVSDEYLVEYRLRHRAATFAEYAIGHVVRHLGDSMVVDVSERTLKAYQTARLNESAAPKSINEEVGFLVRLLGERGDEIRARLRRQKSLKLAVRSQVGKAFSPDDKQALFKAAKSARSPVIFPALMLALHAGLRDAEILGLQWGRVDLVKAYLTVGESKTEAGEGRTIPLNSALLDALVKHSKWYTDRFGTIRPEWYLFPFGKSRNDPWRPMVTLKTSWTNVRTKAKVEGRWHDNRHTLITDLAESGAGDETIRDIAGHVSKRMLKHYSHIRMEAKRHALEAIVPKPVQKDDTAESTSVVPSPASQPAPTAGQAVN
jgi:integrase